MLTAAFDVGGSVLTVGRSVAGRCRLAALPGRYVGRDHSGSSRRCRLSPIPCRAYFDDRDELCNNPALKLAYRRPPKSADDLATQGEMLLTGAMVQM
jgi:hypothetical protein